MSDSLVWLVERDVIHLASAHLHRFYLCTGAGYQCRRTDSTPDLPYVPLVEQPADMTLIIKSYGETAGDSRAEVGETRLANPLGWGSAMPIRYRNLTTGQWGILPAGDRPLSHLWTDYARAARRLAVWVGPQYGSRDTDFTLLFSVGEELASLARSAIVLRPRDRAVDFDTAALTETYGGAGGLDGTADLKGKTKERCFGHVLSLSPTYLGVIGGRHTYSVNGGHPIKGVLRFRDGYVDRPEVASNPGPTQWSQDRSTGIITLGGAAGEAPVAFGATCEVEGDMSGGVYRCTIADLIRYWATGHSGILTAPGGLDVPSFAALNAAAPDVIGKWLPAGSTDTLRSLFDDAVKSKRAYWLMDELERLSVGQFLPAAGPPVRTLRRGIDHFGLVPREVAGRKIPAKAALIRVGRNYAVSADAATLDRNLTGDARNIAQSEWRECRTPDDAGVIAAYGANIARVIERNTLLRDTAAGTTEGLALRADASVPRDEYDLPCTTLFPELRRGDVVLVQDDLPGFEAGKLARILGVGTNARAGITTLTLRE